MRPSNEDEKGNMFLNAHVTNRALLCVDFGFVGCEVIIEKLFREMEKKLGTEYF